MEKEEAIEKVLAAAPIKKAGDEFLPIKKLNRWGRDISLLQVAIDHAQNKKRLIGHVSILD